jgi:hypothetical protein
LAAVGARELKPTAVEYTYKPNTAPHRAPVFSV